MLAAGGVADGDWPSGGLEGVCKHRSACVFLIEEKKIGIRGRANRRPTNAPTVYVKQDVVGAWIIIDIQLCVREKRPYFGLFCWTVGWWEVF